MKRIAVKHTAREVVNLPLREHLHNGIGSQLFNPIAVTTATDSTVELHVDPEHGAPRHDLRRLRMDKSDPDVQDDSNDEDLKLT